MTTPDHISPIDPIVLSQALIRLDSVTPCTGDSLDLLVEALEPMGFTCHKLVFHELGEDSVPNLYARLGEASPNFCFAGHTDVVPVGASDQWQAGPFDADIIDGQLWGRGAADMKSAIAAFVAAVSKYLAGGAALKGSLSFLITGDEEGPAINGTKKLLQWLTERGEVIDHCLVGEPTNPNSLGEMAKIGRRGSLHGMLRVDGIQGHVAYPDRAKNPIPDIVKLLAELNKDPLDRGNAFFQPSNLEIVNIDVGNESHNVIPAAARARFNARFCSEWTGETLQTELTQRLNRAGVDYHIDWWLSGEAFLTGEGVLSTSVQDAVEAHTGQRPELSTTGGTSDARFIKNMCPVVEFGLVGATMHKVDEHVSVNDIHTLTRIYTDIIIRMVG